MVKPLEVFLSNRLEILYQQLKCSLFDPSGQPLMRRIVVVYGPAMKNWLILRMAQDPDLNVAMGVEFIYLSQAFDFLLGLTKEGNSFSIPTLLELTLAIENEISHLIRTYPTMGADDQRAWQPVMDHLKLSPDASNLSRKLDRRLIGLSQNLARLFQDYGRYAFKMIERWESGEAEGWQPRLWRNIFIERKEWKWQCPVRALQHDPAPAGTFTLNIFSISFMTASEFDYLNRLSQYADINYYLLSPCAVFWSDIRSDREKVCLEKYWQKKLGADSAHVLKLEELLRDRNPLLANFGRIGREMTIQIEESMAQTSAAYALPQNVCVLGEDLFVHDDLHLIETQAPLSLLHALQADLLMMRNPQGHASIDLEDEKGSIQLHAASCRRREIEILYHNLLALMQQDPTLCPSDIIVMAPQIEEYVPYIQSVFGQEQSQLDFQILDLALQSQSGIVQGFLQFIELSDGRWDAIELLQLFEHPSFQRRHQISKSDFLKIQEWVEEAGIRWGDDAHHRNELLRQRHCQNGMADETMVGTWDYGVSRLLLGLATASGPAPSLLSDAIPCSAADFSDADLLGKWIRILHSLRDDLTPLQDKSRLNMEDWTGYLICLLESYFQPDYEDPQSVNEYDELKGQIEILRGSSRFIPEAVFSFASVKTHLMALLNHRGIVYREDHLQAIRFCSLMPLRSIPSKAIALLGMQEGAFPRAGSPSSLNLMADEKEADYCPSSNDFDRHLFLEALHSAQHYLLVSYCGYSRQENKDLNPSLVIDELFSYLDKYYTIEGKKPSDKCIIKHPFDRFDPRYFDLKTGLHNFSQTDFRIAQAATKNNKRDQHALIKDFTRADRQSIIIPSGSCIDLRHLNSIMRDPIRFNLNKAAEIYLQTEEDRRLKTEENLTLSNLDHSILKKAGLKAPIEDILKQSEKEGILPFGLFKTVANDRLRKESAKLNENLQQHSLKPSMIFEIEFSTNCMAPIWENGRWIFPPVSLFYEDGYHLKIVGKLPHATSKGLLDLSEGSFPDIWKAWPNFLLYCCAAKSHPEDFEPQLISTEAAQPKKAFFNDPEPYLKQLIRYYALCLENFSPLMPDWILWIREGDHKKLQESIAKLHGKSFSGYQNPYLQLVFKDDSLPMSESIFLNWKEEAKLLTDDLMLNWFAAKQKREAL